MSIHVCVCVCVCARARVCVCALCGKSGGERSGVLTWTERAP